MGRLHPLSGRDFHPLEAPGLSWRTVVPDLIDLDGRRIEPGMALSLDLQAQRANAGMNLDGHDSAT